jgi:hypothetical protein
LCPPSTTARPPAPVPGPPSQRLPWRRAGVPLATTRARAESA